jgi:hypothetical protein
VDGHIVTEDGAHDVDLLEDPINDVRAVAGAYEKLLDARTKEPAFDLELGAALVFLGIDHVDARRGHREVVDVGPGPGDASVVQNAQRVRREFVEAGAKPLLADRTGVPGLGGLRVVAERQDEPTEFRVLGPDALCGFSRSAFELAACGCSGGARIDGFDVWSRLVYGPAVSHAADRPARPFVDRLGLFGKHDVAHATGARVSQARPLLVGHRLVTHMHDGSCEPALTPGFGRAAKWNTPQRRVRT